MYVQNTGVYGENQCMYIYMFRTKERIIYGQNQSMYIEDQALYIQNQDYE